MPPKLPPCPHLPLPRDGLDWRVLHAFRHGDRGRDFYLACLEYAQSLWQRRQPARALLCLDRAFAADLADDAVLAQWIWPYAATAWLVTYAPEDLFIGNPRVHFQHYAGRMNEPRRERRRWRAWACWAIVRGVRPELPGDPRHVVSAPSRSEIEHALHEHGTPGEAELWRGVLADCRSAAESQRALPHAARPMTIAS